MRLDTEVHFLDTLWSCTTNWSGGVRPSRPGLSGVSAVHVCHTTPAFRLRSGRSAEKTRAVVSACEPQTGYHTCMDMARPPP